MELGVIQARITTWSDGGSEDKPNADCMRSIQFPHKKGQAREFFISNGFFTTTSKSTIICLKFHYLVILVGGFGEF